VQKHIFSKKNEIYTEKMSFGQRMKKYRINKS